jgi:hypothetical protein
MDHTKDTMDERDVDERTPTPSQMPVKKRHVVTGDDEVGAEALGAGAGALAGAGIGAVVAGPPGAVVGGIVGAAGGAIAGESAEGDEEGGAGVGAGAGTIGGAAIGGALAGPPGAVVGGAVGAGAGAGIGDKVEEEAEDVDRDSTAVDATPEPRAAPSVSCPAEAGPNGL